MTTPVPDAAVRTAGEADAEEIARVQYASWEADLLPLLTARAAEGIDPGAIAAAWRSSLAAPPSVRHRALIATEAGRTVGAVALAPTDPADGPAIDAVPEHPAETVVADLVMLSVEPAARRRGHGSRLLNAAVDTARANSFEEIQAWVPSADEATVTFLETAGLHRDGARRARLIEADTTVEEVRLSALVIDR